MKIGIPESDIVIEENSRNTAENAEFTAKVLGDSAKDTQLLITSAFHMRRSKACFDKVGLKTKMYSTDFYQESYKYSPDKILIPSAEALSEWQMIIKEMVGYMTYKISGKI